MRRLILFLPFALAACATTMADGGAVQIETRAGGQALFDANCIVITRNGSWQVVTPGIVRVGDTNGDMHVICDKPGYRTSEFVYRAGGPVSGSSLGVGVGGGGRVGFGLGLSVPIGGGGGGTYPSRVIVDMNPQ